VSLLALSLVALPAAAAGFLREPAEAGVHQQGSPHLRRGVELLRSNNIDAAIVELEAAVAEQPANPAAQYFLGRALMLAGRNVEAIVHLDTALPTAADRGTVQLVRGEVLLALDRLEEAQAALDEADAARPGYPPIAYHLAELCYRAGKPEKAMEKFAAAAAISPKWTAPSMRAGEIAVEMGDAERAAEFYRTVIEIAPDEPVFWIRYGDALAALPDFEAAVEAYRQAVAVNPDFPPARLALGYLYFNEQQFEPAERVLEEFLERWPSTAQAQVPLAEIRMINGEHEAALALIESAFEEVEQAARISAESAGDPRGPLAVGIRELQAQILMNLDRLDEAENVARILLEVDPRNLDAMFVLGSALARKGDLEGREHLVRFKTLSDAREATEMGMQQLMEAHNPDAASEEFQRALALDSENLQALQGLGAAQVAMGHYREAVLTLTKARQAGAGGVEWFREWVIALYGDGREDEARLAWREARSAGLTLGPRVWTLLKDAGEACQ
jgi:tetratricopeptide (TPR) repeat protein